MVDDRFAITFDGNHGNGIVGSFCGNLNLAVDEIARLVKRLGTSEFSSYLDDAYGAACAERGFALPSADEAMSEPLHKTREPPQQRRANVSERPRMPRSVRQPRGRERTENE